MKKRVFIAVALAAFSLVGCNSSEQPSVTVTQPSTVIPVNDHTFLAESPSVFIGRGGKISSLDVEMFTENYYDIDELKSRYVEPSVSAYNQAAGEGKATLVSLEKKNDRAYLQIDFASTEDYLAFNKENNKYFADWKTLTVCDYDKISEAGYAIPAELFDPDGNPLTSAQVKADVELHVCVIDLGTGYPTGFSGSFMFAGDVAYVSSGITVDSINGVTIADAPGLQYIIFK